MREALLRAGARQFAARGIGTVSVEELLAEADVSRATFYGFFSSKYSLLEELLHPIFKDGVAAVTALEKRPAREALVGITCVYLDLWRAHREGLALIPTMDSASFERFEAHHQALNDALMTVLMKAERANLLRNGSASYTLQVLARTAIPLLNVYAGHPSGEALFEDAMRALLMTSS